MAPSRGTDGESLTQALLDDSDFLRRIVERTLQQVLEAEMTAHVGAERYEPTDRHRQRIRSTNGWERLMQEIKRRTRVIRIFPNREACLRLVTALRAEQSDEWISGTRYLDMSELWRWRQGQEEEEATLAAV